MPSFAATKTGWFRGFCSYYAKKERMRERDVLQFKWNRNGMRRHETFFFLSPLFLLCWPSTLEKFIDSCSFAVCARECFNNTAFHIKCKNGICTYIFQNGFLLSGILRDQNAFYSRLIWIIKACWYFSILLLFSFFFFFFFGRHYNFIY